MTCTGLPYLFSIDFWQYEVEVDEHNEATIYAK